MQFDLPGTQRHSLTGHTICVQTVAIAPNGTWLATGGLDGTARIWDPVTGTQRHTLPRQRRQLKIIEQSGSTLPELGEARRLYLQTGTAGHTRAMPQDS